MTKKIITYENAIVTFLDILGFKEIVKNSSADDISKLLTAIERQNKLDAGFVEGYKPIVHIFSDTIIRIRPVETKENRKHSIGLLFHELLDLVFIQSNLLLEETFMRGAVSFGKVYYTKTQVFGPGVVRAYELEQGSAIYPRIILDPLLLQEFDNNSLLQSDINFDDELKYIHNLLKEGDDGFLFIDYLRAIGRELDSEEEWVSLLYKFKDLIIKKVKNQNVTDNVLQKYMWLAYYFNNIVKSLEKKWFEKRNMDIEELLLTENDIPSLKGKEKL